MRADLVRDSWREQRLLWWGYAVAWSVLVGMYLAAWPVVRGSGQRYDALVAHLPDAMRSLLGSTGPGGLSTAGGYLTAELLAFTGPVLAAAMGIVVATRAVAGDEESGAMELLLAQPVRRSRVVLAKSAATAGGLVLVLLAPLTLLVAAAPGAGLPLSAMAALRALAMLALLAVEAAALGVLAAALTGSVGRSRAIAGGIAMGAFLLHVLGPLISPLRAAAAWSPFQVVVASDPFRHPVGMAPVLELLLPAVALTLAAAAVLSRRDLRFP